jgi:hypothetical protein
VIDFSKLQPAWPVEGNCPDCNVEIPRNEEERKRLGSGPYTHHDGCPVGRSLDEMSDRDRAFFEAHPGTDRFYRKPYLCEITDIRIMNGLTHLEGTMTGKVLVQRVGPGVRSRMLDDLRFIPAEPLPSTDDDWFLEAVALACNINGCVIVAGDGTAVPIDTIEEMGRATEEHRGAVLIVSDVMRKELEEMSGFSLPETKKAVDSSTGRYAIAMRIP